MQERTTYKKFAFISYSHRDIRAAKWLQHHLERFRLPSEIHNEIEAGCRYLRPVFRDESDLQPGILSAGLRKNLEESKFLILICSKNSADSDWVSQEARAFVEMGRIDRIIPVVIPEGGYSELDLFPKYLREYFVVHPECELLGVNWKAEGRQKALIRIVSRMLDVDFDSLWKRHQRQRRARIAISSTIAALVVVCGYLFAMPVTLNIDLGVQPSQLPKGPTTKLIVEGAEYSNYIDDSSYESIKIPGYKRFNPVSIKASSEYCVPLDTTISPGLGLSKNITLELERDDTFALYKGTVYDEDMNPIQGAKANVAGFKAFTDANGWFSIRIPLEHQRENLPIHITHPNHGDFARPDECPSTDINGGYKLPD